MVQDPKKSISEQGKTIVKEGGDNILKRYAKVTDAGEVVGGKETKTLKQPGRTPEGDAAYAAKSPEERKAQDDKYKSNPANWDVSKSEAVVKPGKSSLDLQDIPTPGSPGTEVDTFKPWEQRQSNRRAKVARRDERQVGKQTARRLAKGFKTGAYSESDVAPGGEKTYGQIYKEAKVAKAGGGQLATDPFNNPSKYDSSTQGTVYNPNKTKSVEYGSKPQPKKEGSPKTKLTERQVQDIQKSTDYRSIEGLKGHRSDLMYDGPTRKPKAEPRSKPKRTDRFY